jgi:hypothetical protein
LKGIEMTYFNRPEKVTVDFENLFEQKPKHRNCHMHIATSLKNSNYRGLYCSNHHSWLMWINPQQEKFLNDLGITEEVSPHDLYS